MIHTVEDKKDKIYYWLRLDRNFFKRHDIRIIENMENGKEYVLFYMKLLLESIDHVGNLRFNELIPYNDSMLGTITNTNIDIVRSAIKVFQQLDMLEILDDQTIFITDTQKMLGEAKSNERVKRYREKQKYLPIVTACNVTETLHVTEIELEKEKEIDIKTYSVFFETLWNEYPRKKEKAKAYKCYQARIKDGYSDEELLQAIKNYSADCKTDKTEDRYIKLCATFLGPNTPFIDYLDKNYKPSKPQDKPKSINKFNQFPQRTYTAEDYAELEKALLKKRL